MNPVMSNTKWEELRLAMHSIAPLTPRWRTRDVATGIVSQWDTDWFYHFRIGGYDTIEWVEIEVISPEHRNTLCSLLAAIHVPGEETYSGYRVFGYVAPGMPVNYVSAKSQLAE